MDITYLLFWMLYMLVWNFGVVSPNVDFVISENDPCPGELYDISLTCTVTPFTGAEIIYILKGSTSLATNFPSCIPLAEGYEFTCNNGTFDFTIKNATESDHNGEWTCQVSSPDNDKLSLSVKAPINNHKVFPGTDPNLILECLACGYPPPEFLFQEAEQDITNDDRYIIEITNETDVSGCESGSLKSKGTLKVNENPSDPWVPGTYEIGCAPKLPHSSCELTYETTNYNYLEPAVLSGGAIAGIVLLSVAVVAVIIGGVVYVMFFKEETKYTQ